MNKETLIERLMVTFVEEMEEHVAVLNRDLIHLEKVEPDKPDYDQLLRSIFRTVHSLKGASRSVDLSPIEQVCHEMEELFASVRDDEAMLNPKLFRVLFGIADELCSSGAKLRQHKSLDEPRLKELHEELSSAIAESCRSDGSPSVSTKVCPDELPSKTLVPEPITEQSEEKERESSQNHISDNLVSKDVPATPAEVPSQPNQDVGPSIQPVHNVIESKNGIADTINTITGASTKSESSSIKVASGKLDSLLAQSGELLAVYRKSEVWLEQLSELQDQLKGTNLRNTGKLVDKLFSTMKSDLRNLCDSARQVDEEIRSLRMRPFSELCLGMERTVRDIGAASGKKVRVVVCGGDVELDRAILERLKSPLNHLLRNAIQHGLEPVSDRQKSGKDETGTITVSACVQGSQVQIKIEDDGRGIDVAAVRAQAARHRMPIPQSDEEAADMLFLPGFSTSTTVNEISGRGVGLDVVANELLNLQGSINVSHQVGRGTCFVLNVPLTLTKIRVLFVRLNEQTYAFPSSNIETLLRIDCSEVVTVQGRQVLRVRDRFVSVTTLARDLNIDQRVMTLDDKKKLPIVVVRYGNTLRAYIVDELLTEQEVVVTNLGARLQRVRYLSGSTLQPNGEIALIINSAELIRRNSNNESSRETALFASAEPSKERKKRLIVADDSLTTRILQTSILESAGYEVSAASDGQICWELLNSEGADLIVSDVEMPQMDGFTLTRTIRESSQWRDLPVILVTSLKRDKDRARGLEAGANAYVAKSDFDQKTLLETIAQLV
ncbi:MAG TPA: hybrid sensor histidine kinase/response regulator [Oculatellaceae cyanobacterium]